jgi:hypothetical protein
MTQCKKCGSEMGFIHPVLAEDTYVLYGICANCGQGFRAEINRRLYTYFYGIGVGTVADEAHAILEGA